MSDAIDQARAERAASRDGIGLAASRLAAARAALAAAGSRRLDDPERRALESEHAAALADLEAAKRAESAALARLDELLKEFREAPIRGIAQLDAGYPVAFFPIRIETRFRRSAPDARGEPAGELLVRIYPDGILAVEHEPLLTAREVEAGRAYWRRAWSDGHERDAWTLLLKESSPPRASWIVARTVPANPDDRPDGGGSAAKPQFEEIGTRPDGWHRAPEAQGLPERWIVCTYRGGERLHQVFSEPVREGLALTFRLSGDAGESGTDDLVDLTGDGLVVEPQVRWVYDFEAAREAGMAVRIPLGRDDLEQGFSRLIVVGLRTSRGPESAAGEIEALFEASNASRGVAFVPQGSKTNNTKENPSAYPPADPAGAVTFATYRGPSLAVPGRDGERFMKALGVAPATADHVWGADRDEQSAAVAMADSLWPATMGYFLRQMMAPHAGAATVRRLRAHLREHVRGRGAYPAFRFGPVPYGLLPVGPLPLWAEDPEDDFGSAMAGMLQRLARDWARLAAGAPHVGRSADPDADLVETLGMDASAQTVQIRRTLGHEATWNIYSYSGIDLRAWENARRAVAQQMLQSLGQPGWDPRILHMDFARTARDFAGPLVEDRPLSEADPLEFDYIAWLRTATPTMLRDQAGLPSGKPMNALLYLMLRHGLLAEYDSSAKDLLGWRKLLLAGEDREPELLAIVPGSAAKTPQRTAWERLDLTIAGVTGKGTLGQLLADPLAAKSARAPEVKSVLDGMAAHRGALHALEGLPTAELDRLFTETLDIFSHRLDAWLVGLYVRRLQQMRKDRPRGMHIGCYGWVEDVRADPPAKTVTVSTSGGTEEARTDSGGYIYAPSMLHGATAAVLRSAYLARSGPGREAYAVDLSSRRVRTALWLIDTVREDQPLGAALGYQFERGLHENHAPLELDKFIDEFRELYALVANKAEASGEAAESVAARNVVDGLRLREAWRAASIPWGSAGLAASDAERAAIEAELAQLDDAVDAVSDLMTAEAVHQVLKGSTAGASASLDSLAKGARAPEPEVATIPRSGTVLHQRCAIALGDGTLDAGWAALPSSPRAAAAPELNAWLSRLFGPPSAIECVVDVEGSGPRLTTAADLGLQAIDLLLLARAAEAGSPDAEIGHRIAWHIAGVAGSDRGIAVDYEATQSADALSFAQMFEIASAIGRVLGFARPLQPRDLLPPELEGAAADADPMTAEVDGRGAAAMIRLDQAISDLTLALADIAAAPNGSDPPLDALRAGLVRAADLGIPAAFPRGRHGDTAEQRAPLVASAGSVLGELERRRAAAQAEAGGAGRLTGIFGRSFPVVPRFRPAAAEVLAPALASEPDFDGAGGDMVEGWFAGVARVREPLDAWRQLAIYGRALGRLERRPRIVQLPLGSEPQLDRWAALPFGSEDRRPRPGLVSLALLGGNLPQATDAWSGLLLDSWPELLPSVEEDAGVVFHYDAPGAQAPQAVLLAVPPPGQKRWSFDLLEQTLLHTLDLARMRAVDLSNLGQFGQILPLSFLAANPVNDAIATSFVSLLRADAVIQARET